MIESMPDVLRWRDGGDVLADVRATHVAAVADGLGRLLQVAADLPDAAELLDRFRSIGDPALDRILIAPEVSTRLLWHAEADPRDALAFLLGAFRAEATLAGDPGEPPAAATWTGLGDARVGPGAALRVFPRVDGLPPLDFGSPYAAALDVTGADREAVPVRSPFTTDELTRIEARLTAAADGIAAVGPELAAFVGDFNAVLILQADTEHPGSFSSGSNGRYIGRSFLANAHAPGVDAATLADAIVHEGIHGLLYMQEFQRPWFTDLDVMRDPRRIASPWSGNPLPVAPFLQACFVWYGLLHFWALALERGAFERADALRMLQRASRGFLGARLSGHLQPWSASIAPELITVVDELQDTVTAAFGAVA